MTVFRTEKMNNFIQKELGNLLISETHFKHGVFVTIVKVQTTLDISEAHVFVSIFPENETKYVLTSLSRKIGQFEHHLRTRLRRQALPRIVFENDRTEQTAQSVEEILRSIREH